MPPADVRDSAYSPGGWLREGEDLEAADQPHCAISRNPLPPRTELDRCFRVRSWWAHLPLTASDREQSQGSRMPLPPAMHQRRRLAQKAALVSGGIRRRATFPAA